VPSVVVSNPVDVDVEKLSSADRHSLRKSLDTSDASIVIVQTSRLEAWKGHTVLIDALGRLAARSDWTCWIAGGAQRPHEVEYVAALRAQAKRLGVAARLRWLGERQDVRTVLAAADIHCQPNTGAEPFGIAFIEALAAGLPVVATRLGGALEIVDERCGRLVPPDDAPALAATLSQLIEDSTLRRRLADAAPARAKELSDPATQMRRLFEALARVALTTESCRT
jgi:glycosyltransferase involved in cell wall biosynthesis